MLPFFQVPWINVAYGALFARAKRLSGTGIHQVGRVCVSGSWSCLCVWFTFMHQEFRVLGFGCLSSVGFKVLGLLVLWVSNKLDILIFRFFLVFEFRFSVLGSRFRVSGFGFQFFGFRVSGFGFRVSGFGLRVSGFGLGFLV